MQQVYPLFFAPGEVVEIRAIGVHGSNRGWEGRVGPAGIVSGYFDNSEDFARSAAILDAVGAKGVYYTLNPVNPALIARANNRLKVPKSTSQDTDVVCIRWLPIDLDPKRPADISAAEAEVVAAKTTARSITDWMETELGWPRALRGFSGNGYHLMYRLPDLPNDQETHKLMTAAIAVIAGRFSNAAVDIDVKVGNPARIWKLYGTTGRKGDSTTDRPHRKSYLFKEQPALLADVPAADVQLLQSLAAMASPTPPGAPGVEPDGPSTSSRSPGAPPNQPASAPGSPRRMSKQDLGQVDVERYLSHYGIQFNVKQDDVGTMYRLTNCLFDPNHGPNQASIIMRRDGALLYQCFHASCAGYKWKDARQKISGDASIAEFCAGYDPNWTPPRRQNTGLVSSLPATHDHHPAVAGNGAVPAPLQIDAMEFYEKRGKRSVFVPWLLVQYLKAYFAPICHTSGTFWRYSDGVWRELSRHVIGQAATQALKGQAQSAWVDSAIKLLGNDTNREEDQWPNHPLMINCRNGMINMEDLMAVATEAEGDAPDLTALTLLPHDPSYGSRTQLPVKFDPAAYSRRWRQLLFDVFPEDKGPEKEYLLQQFTGYCFLRDARYQKALFLYGTGANGKSTVLDIIQALVGPENASSLTLSDLTQRFKSQYLQNKLVNIATETNTRDPLTTEVLKAVIDGSPITAERKYGEPYQYRPFAKWMVGMNEPPTVPDKSFGFGRRIIVLSFERRFQAAEIVPDMAAQVIEEIDGVFSWALQGLYRILQLKRIEIPGQIEEDTQQMLTTLNPMLIFVQECCDVGPGIYVPTTDIWPAYTAWCHEGRNRPLGRNKFLDQILMSYPSVEKKPFGEAREQSFVGLALNSTGREYMERGKRFNKGRDED